MYWSVFIAIHFYHSVHFVRNSVNVVNEKKVVGAVELRDGTTVDISTGTNKGRVAIFNATILKVCGE